MRNNHVLTNTPAKPFDRYMKKYPQLYTTIAGYIPQYMSLDSPMILDLGTGSGLLAQAIQTILPKAMIVGLDPLPSMLYLAELNTHMDSFQPIQGIAEKLPLKNNVFDLVISRFSLCYWNKPYDGIAEISRVLKPGGIVILEQLDKEFPSWKLHLVDLHMLFNFAGRDVVRYHRDAFHIAHTIDDVERYLITSRFSILTKEGKRKDWKFTIVAQKPMNVI